MQLHMEDARPRQTGEETGVIVFYPLIAGPFVPGGSLVQFVGHMTPLGVLSTFLVDGARRFGAPVLVAIPGSAIVLCVLVMRYLRRPNRDEERPLETTPMCNGFTSANDSVGGAPETHGSGEARQRS